MLRLREGEGDGDGESEREGEDDAGFDDDAEAEGGRLALATALAFNDSVADTAEGARDADAVAFSVTVAKAVAFDVCACREGARCATRASSGSSERGTPSGLWCG
jgi:hypothetical protein